MSNFREFRKIFVSSVFMSLMSISWVSAGTLFSDSFNGSLKKWETRGCGSCFKTSGGELKVTNREGSVRRAEIAPEGTPPKYGQTYHTSFSFRADEFERDGFSIIWQVNSYPYNGLDMSLAIGGGRLKAYTRKGGAKSRNKVSKLILERVEKGRWYDVDLRFRRDTSSGFFDVSINGKRKWSYRGPNTKMDTDRARQKIGAYRGSGDRMPVRVSFSQFRITN